MMNGEREAADHEPLNDKLPLGRAEGKFNGKGPITNKGANPVGKLLQNSRFKESSMLMLF
jgi:hypothetical protein